MTGTRNPEQRMRDIARASKHELISETEHTYRTAVAEKYKADVAFEIADLASRVQRKRDERNVYRAAVQVRKDAQEAKLCRPFPVGNVEV